jgi:hypothetical protein
MTGANQGEDVTPRPYELVESIRDFGYTLPTAIADLVDNCITASASDIAIHIASDMAGHAHIAVVDNGRGMSLDTLIEALRLGSGAPPAERHGSDLGRFGFGLKTASLSQGRSLTVITKRRQDSTPTVRRLDMDHIRQVRSWTLAIDGSPAAAAYAADIAVQSSGTAVVISSLDRTSFFQVAPHQMSEHLGTALKHVAAHLSMVFHRFIEKGLRLRVGATLLNAWDPFLSGRSTVLATETLHFRNRRISVTPYVLPHRSKLTDQEHARAGGPLGWNAHQGFYIYRSERLIVPGTWLNLLLKKEEHFKLARIAVDLPNTIDADWHLNVMKAHVAAPAALRDDFRRIASAARKQASEVYRFRGERAAPTNAAPLRYVWKRETTSGGVRFRVDRTHPAVQALLHGGCDHDATLGHLLEIVESTVPIAAMLQEPTRSLDGAVDPEGESHLAAYVDLARHSELFLIRAGRSPSEARRLVLNAEPFARFQEMIRRHLESQRATE